MVGEKLSHYRILSQLGTGGMGEVYLAEDTRLDRQVAIKLLPAGVTRDHSRLRRFEQEARAASALNHPNIVTVHEIGQSDAGSFIVLEYVKGHTIRTLIDENLAFNSLIPIGRQVARALGVAHEAGIVHRDIKPENIMVRDDGYVKVLDFGLARLGAAEVSPESTAETAVHTNPGSIVGTLSYMSPEQARAETVDGASDIFSLGIIFYEMATGQKPFKADSELAIMHAIVYDQPLPPSNLNPELPRPLEMLILGMLDKNPRLRPTAPEVASALSESEQTISLTSNVITMPIVVSVPTRRTVGREAEREKLHAALRSAESGRGLMLCVTGEAGLGKTTLVEDFLAEILQANPACHIARGRSSERLAGAEAYLPFLEALESLIRKTSNQYLARIMKATAPSWYVQLATSQDSSLERAMAESPTVSQERMKRELAAFLQEAASRSALVLFFDDLHWADPSTVDIIAYIATRLAGMRLLIVATHRSSEMVLNKHPFLPVKLDMQARGTCQELPLEFLTGEDVQRYLALEFPNHRFPKQFAELIYTKTEGSPLFMADVVRYLRDRRVIVEEEGRWSLVQTFPEIESDLPETVRSMIQRKIAQLDDEDRRLLVAASAQGHNFDSAVVSQALSMDAGEVEERLQSLDRTYGFVKYLKEDEFPDHTLTLRYRFVHVLYQNALYATLTPSRRALLSAAIAEALLRFHGKHSSAVASDLAFLFQAARDWSRASDYFLTAARNAARVFANQEAIALCKRGLEMTRRLPDTAERDRQELKLQITAGPSLMTVRGFAATETFRTYLRARELCDQLGDDAQLFRVLFGLSIVAIVRAEYEQARDFAQQCLQLAGRSEGAALLVQAHWVFSLTIQFLGEFVSARDHLERSVTLYDPQRHAAHVFLYGAILNRVHLGRVLLYLGYADQSKAVTQEGIGAAEKMRHPVGLCNTLSVAVSIEAFQNNTKTVREMAEEILFLSDEHGLPYYCAIGRIMRGWARAMQGEVDEGIDEMREGLDAQRNVEIEQQRASYLVLMAEALSKADRVEDGLRVLDEAAEAINKTGEHFYEAELYRIRGELLAGRPSEAEVCLQQAIDIARKQSAKAFELRAATCLARLLRSQAKQERAREHLASVYEWFTEGFDTPDLREAKTLLSELE